MYGFSLADINMVLQKGGQYAGADKGEAETIEDKPPTSPAAEPQVSAPSEAGAASQVPEPPAGPAAVPPVSAPSEAGAVPPVPAAAPPVPEVKPISVMLQEKFSFFVENLIAELNITNWSERFNRPPIWSVLTGLSIMLIIAGMIISLVILILLITKQNRLNKIKIENRYNADHPAYLMARSKKLSLRDSMLNLLLLLPLVLPLLAILCMIAILIHWKYFMSNTALKPSLPFGFIFFVFVFSGISLIIISIRYAITQMNLKNMRKRVLKFENDIYKDIYRDKSFLDILYNDGTPPKNEKELIDIMKNAANTTNFSTNKEQTKIIYTLGLYNFMMTDLTDNYKTKAMELFRYILISLPEKSRIFKIADFMRSNNNLNISLNKNLLEKIITNYKINDSKIFQKEADILLKNISDSAFTIKAYEAYKPIDKLSITSVLCHWFIVLAVLLYLLSKFVSFKKLVIIVIFLYIFAQLYFSTKGPSN